MAGQPERRPHLQRVPPHDNKTEAHLLGAALINHAAAGTVAAVDPAVWYNPKHTTLAAAIAELVNTGRPTDIGTVGAHLHAQGQLEQVGGWTALTDLAADTPTVRSAEHWADLLEEYAAKRRELSLAAEIVEAVYRGVPTTGLAATLHEAALAVDQTRTSSWEAVNLARVLAGEDPEPAPSILARTDGIYLLYPGKVHVVNAEPEAGKSWLALVACIGEMDRGEHVLYVDCEDSAGGIVGRLLQLGASAEAILDRFHYVRPDDPLNPAAASRLVALAEVHRPSLAVVDGVTEAMSLAGLSIKDNDDIARFYALLPRPIVRVGPAVVLLDHVVKDKESQGRWGIGGQHKLAAIDGVTFKFERVTPFSPGHAGSSRLTVSKDRAGKVRAHAAGRADTIALVRYTPVDAHGALDVTVEPDEERSASWDGPSHCRDALLELLSGMAGEEFSVNQMADKLRARGQSFRNGTVSVAADQLAESGHLTMRSGPRRSRLFSYPSGPGEASLLDPETCSDQGGDQWGSVHPGYPPGVCETEYDETAREPE